MSNFPCKFHPDRVAVTKCEKCNSFICLECKNTYRSSHTSYGHHHRHSYASTYELCPICYAEKVNTSTNPICYIFPVIFVVFFMIMAGSMFSEANSWGMGPPAGFQAFFFIIPVIMIGFLGYQCVIRGPQMRQEAEKRKEKAMSGVQGILQSNVDMNYNKVNSNLSVKSTNVYCRQCGSILEPGEKYCSNCGNTTFDEFHQ